MCSPKYWGPALAIVLAFGCEDGAPAGPDAGVTDLSQTDGSAPQGPCDQAPGGREWENEILRFENPDQDIRIILRRDYVGDAVGHTVQFKTSIFAIWRNGTCLHSTDPAKLDYKWAHHNWDDTATAQLGDGTYELHIKYVLGIPPASDPGWRPALVKAPGLAAEIPLVVTGGVLACFGCPGYLPITINEFMPNNTKSWKDEHGNHVPWIELMNQGVPASTEDVSLDGYYLTDDPTHRKRWPLPSGITLKHHEHLVLAADGKPDRGQLHTSFALQPGGGQLMLVGPDGTSVGERSYGAVPADTSLTPSRDKGAYTQSSQPTPGMHNPDW